MVISKYRRFPRNIDSLGITAKNNFLGKIQFFQGDLKYCPFTRNVDSFGIAAKNNFLGNGKFFQGDLKLSSFYAKY